MKQVYNQQRNTTSFLILTLCLWRENARSACLYGFTGHEKDDEISGSGNSYTTEYRLYDSRLGTWKRPYDPNAKFNSIVPMKESPMSSRNSLLAE